MEIVLYFVTEQIFLRKWKNKNNCDASGLFTIRKHLNILFLFHFELAVNQFFINYFVYCLPPM